MSSQEPERSQGWGQNFYSTLVNRYRTKGRKHHLMCSLKGEEGKKEIVDSIHGFSSHDTTRLQ